MRPGHNSSGSPQEGLQANSPIQALLKAIPPHEVIDNDGAQGEPASMAQALGRHLAMAIEHAFKLLLAVLYRPRAQLVQETSHLNPGVGVRVRSTAWGDQDAACGSAALMPR